MTREEARKEIHSVFSNYLPFDGDKEADEVITALEKGATVSDGCEDKEPVLDQIIAEIQRLRGCSCSFSDGIIDDVEDIIGRYKKSNG